MLTYYEYDGFEKIIATANTRLCAFDLHLGRPNWSL